MMHRFKKLSFVVLIGLASAHTASFAGLFDDEEARRAILDIRQKLANLDQRLAKLETTSSQGQLALVDSITERDREIARLRGEIEVATNSLRRLQDDNRALYVDLDKRIKSLEPKAVELDGKVVEVPPQQQSDYQTALNVFKSGNFDEAQRQFSRFLEVHRGSTLEPQVRYFLGSSQYATGKYKEALITQRDLAKEFPEHPRAPDALLSQASSQLELKSIEGAKKTLRSVIELYPTSSAAAGARERLAALK
ncbi:MAG: tol-pal system protein YbgF [Limnobacter sp.]|nr:tol-pal system protein YbgF [Limnobacter sp.]